MAKTVLSLVLAGFILLNLAACGSSAGETTPTPRPTLVPTPTRTITGPPDEKQYRWLKGIPCSPPCWEGITPGKTSATEALELLNKNPLIASTGQLVADDAGKEAGIVWNWSGEKNISGYVGEGGAIFYDYSQPGKPVISINPKYNTVFLTLQDVILAYGNPDYVLGWLTFPADDSRIEYDIKFIYSNLGFTLFISYFLGKPDKPAITKDMRLNRGIEFFEPGIQNLSKLYNDPNLSKGLVPWQGFKEFDFYCRRMDGSPCKYTIY